MGMRLRSLAKEGARVEQNCFIRCCTPSSWRVEGLLDTNDFSSSLVALSEWRRLANARNMSQASEEQVPMMLGLCGSKESSRMWKFNANPTLGLC